MVLVQLYFCPTCGKVLRDSESCFHGVLESKRFEQVPEPKAYSKMVEDIKEANLYAIDS